MGEEVYSGDVKLNIKPFEDALSRLEKRLESTLTVANGRLQALENIFGALGSKLQAVEGQITTAAQGIVVNLTNVGNAGSTGIAKLGGAAQKAGTETKGALKNLQADLTAFGSHISTFGTQAEQNFQKVASGYQRLAERVAKAPQARLGQLDNATAQREAELAKSVAQSIEELTKAKQRLAAAQEAVQRAGGGDAAVFHEARQEALNATEAYKKLQEQTALAQGELRALHNVQELVAERRAALANTKGVASAEGQQARAELELREQVARQAVAVEKERVAQVEAARKKEVALSKRYSAEELAAFKGRLQQELAALTEHQQNLQNVVLRQNQVAARQAALRVNAEKGGYTEAAAAAQKAYQNAVEAAERAADEEKRVAQQRQRLLGDIRGVETREAVAAYKQQEQAAKELAAAQEKIGQEAGQRFGRGFRQSLTDIKSNFAQLEEKYNSIFRAGSQISSVGTQLSLFGAGVLAVGNNLKDTAADFDFFIRRTEAAALSAGSSGELIDSLTGKTIPLREALSDLATGLGREVGSDDLAGIADGLYVYQSAAGDAITSIDDLRVAQEGLTAIFQSSVITDADYADTMRGILQVLAEFGLQADSMDDVTRILMNVTQITQSELPDVIEAFKFLGPLANEIGMPVEQVAAILGKLSEYGLKGSMAGRGLAMALEAITSPSQKASGALQDLLITSQGLSGTWQEILAPGGDIRGLLTSVDANGKETAGTISILANALAGMNEAQKIAYINSVFAQNNAARVMIPLLLEETRAIEAKDSTLKKTAVTYDQLNGVYQDLLAQEAEQAVVVDSIARSVVDLDAATRTDMLKRVFAGSENAAGLQLQVENAVNKLHELGPAADGAGQSVQDLYKQFTNGAEQARLFDKQWETISGSIRVRFGKVMAGIKAQLITVGTAVAEALLPVLDSAGKLIDRFMAWARENEDTARSLIKFVGVLALLAVTAGPLLVVFGGVIQGLVGVRIAFAGVGSVIRLVGQSILGLIPGLGAVSAPLWLLIGIVGLLAYAVFNNVGGIRDSLSGLLPVFDNVKNAVLAFVRVFTEAFRGNSEGVKQAIQELSANLVQGVARAIFALGEVLGALLPVLWDAVSSLVIGVGKALVNGFVDAFQYLADNLPKWAAGLINSIAQGLWDSALAVLPNVLTGIANLIGGYFETHSPPKVGPLKNILVWAQGLIDTYAAGLKEADFSALEESVGIWTDAIKLGLEEFGGSGSYVDGVKLANELMLEYMETVRGGGEVSGDFFEGLRGYLGDWYENVEALMLAYQEVYRLNSLLGAEQERLDLVKAQRAELQAQYEIRKNLFDDAVAPTGPDYFESYKDQVVDPSTAEGQAQIEAMRAALSTEEFQSWIAFQQRLWESQYKSQDRVLRVQEDSINAAIAGYKAQLEIVQAQYDYYLRIYNLHKDLAGIKDPNANQGGGGGGGGSEDANATNADLEEARRQVRKISGEDQAIKDEATLAAERGGPVEGIGGADEQRDREAGRIKDLDAANRKKQAEFDVRKIQAEGDKDKLDAIDREEEAWNAAYKEEKARVQERKNLTGEVLDASNELADVTKPERVDKQKAEYAKEIKENLGEQAEHLKDSKELQKDNADLAGAETEARKQSRVEERELGDLRDLNQAKQLEFEERLKDAAGDEEKIRKINEEKEAWDLAYKQALQAQEERAEAAKQALQDILDLKEALADAERAAGGSGGGFAGGGVPKFEGGSLGSRGGIAGGGVSIPGVEIPYGDPSLGGTGASPLAGSPQEDTTGGSSSGDWGGATKGDLAKISAATGADLSDYPADGSDAEKGAWALLNPVDNMLLNRGLKYVDKGYTPRPLQPGEAPGADLERKEGVEAGLTEDAANAAKIPRTGGAIPGLGINTEGLIARATAAQDSYFAAILNNAEQNLGPGAVARIQKTIQDNLPPGIEASFEKVNGKWVVKIDDLNENATKAMATSLEQKLTGKLGGTADQVALATGQKFYKLLTGEKNFPSTVDELVNKVSGGAYKLLTGKDSPPATVEAMTSDVGKGFYKLLTGEDAPAKSSQEFITKLGGIFKELGIDGPIPTNVEEGMKLVGEHFLTHMSPTGKLPTTVAEGMRLIGEDFFKKLSPDGELPKTVTDGLRIVGDNFATTLLNGPNSVSGLTKEVMGSVGTLWDAGLKNDPNSVVNSTAAAVAATKDQAAKLNDPNSGIPIEAERAFGEANRKAQEFGNPFSGIPFLTGLAFEQSKTFTAEKLTGPGGMLPLLQGAFGQIVLDTQALTDGEGGIVKTYTTAAQAIQNVANIYFGATGTIATAFSLTATAAQAAADAAARAAQRAANNGSTAGQTEKAPAVAALYGNQQLPGGTYDPVLVTAHGQEAVLSQVKGDAPLYRRLVSSGVWEQLKGAIKTSEAAKSLIGRQDTPQASAPRAALPVASTPLQGAVGKVVNFNIGRIDVDNSNEKDNFLAQVAKVS